MKSMNAPITRAAYIKQRCAHAELPGITSCSLCLVELCDRDESEFSTSYARHFRVLASYQLPEGKLRGIWERLLNCGGTKPHDSPRLVTNQIVQLYSAAQWIGAIEFSWETNQLLICFQDVIHCFHFNSKAGDAMAIRKEFSAWLS